MGKLRFDLAADAINSLQRYLDVSADEESTITLLKDAENAVEELIVIEFQLGQQRSTAKRSSSDITSALAQIEKRVGEVQERIAPVRDFLKEYQSEILQMQLFAAHTQALVTIINAMRSVDKQLEAVKRRVTISQ